MKEKGRFFFVFQEKTWVLVLWVLAGAFIFQNLGEAPIGYFDELKSAERSTCFLTTGDWGVVSMNHVPNFNKPPLQYWLNALVHLGQADKEFSIRWVNALFCMGIFLVLPFWVRTLLPGVKWIAPLALFLLLIYGPFLEYARIGILDMGSAFLCFVIWIFIEWARKDPRWWVGVALVCVLGSLQKTPLAFAIWVFALAVSVCRGEGNSLKSPWLWGSVIVAVAVASIWPILQMLRYGDHYFDTYVKYELTEMVRRDVNLGPATYLVWVAKKWFLFTGIALIGSVWILFSQRLQQRKCLWLAAMWALLFFIGMSCLTGHSHRYLFPVLPIFAVIAAWCWLKVLGNMPVLSLSLLVLFSVPCVMTAHYHYHIERLEYAKYIPLWEKLAEIRDNNEGDHTKIVVGVSTDFNSFGMMLGTRYYGEVEEQVLELKSKDELRELLKVDRPLMGVVSKGYYRQIQSLSSDVKFLLKVDDVILVKVN